MYLGSVYPQGIWIRTCPTIRGGTRLWLHLFCFVFPQCSFFFLFNSFSAELTARRRTRGYEELDYNHTKIVIWVGAARAQFFKYPYGSDWI